MPRLLILAPDPVPTSATASTPSLAHAAPCLATVVFIAVCVKLVFILQKKNTEFTYFIY